MPTGGAGVRGSRRMVWVDNKTVYTDRTLLNAANERLAACKSYVRLAVDESDTRNDLYRVKLIWARDAPDSSYHSVR